MSLKWKKLGERTWFGEDGSYRYTVDQRPFNLGGTRFHVTRGGIASGNRFGSAGSLSAAKGMAQIDATRCEDRFIALPNYDAATFCK